MFQQLAKNFMHGRDTTPALTRSFSPVLVWDQRTAGSRTRRPSLKCVWRTDRSTGRLECRWISVPDSEALALEPDPSPLPRAVSFGHLLAA
jgi:hypothetical protein